MRIVVVGGGGHASDVLGVVEALGHTVVGFQDDRQPELRRFEGRARHIGPIGDPCDATEFAWGLGWPGARRAVLPRLRLAAATLIHPSATVHPNVRIGEGVVIMAGAIVSAGAVIGDHVLIHHNAIIGHDCEVGRFTSVMPGAAVSGDVSLGEGCLIGANATVIQGLMIGARAVLGAGAVATRDLPADMTAVGKAAKPLPPR